MNQRLRFQLILLWLTLMPLTGCGGDSSERLSPTQAAPSEQTEREAMVADSAFPVRVKDYRGREVEIAKLPQRIVSLLPSHTETLFALGAGSQMVACTSLCDYPPETSQLKKIALANPGSISLEALVALQPDLIVVGGDYHRQLETQLTKLNIPVLSLESQSIADIEHSLLGLARATGHTEKGKALVEELQREIQQLQEQIKPFQKEERPRVFYRVWDQPLMTAGPESFIGELITLAGGDNVFADVEIAYPQVSEETLILRNPEVIVMPRMKSDPADTKTVLQELRQRPGWSKMDAVQQERIYLIEDDLISRPGPRVVQGLQKVAQALYPEAFPNP